MVKVYSANFVDVDSEWISPVYIKANNKKEAHNIMSQIKIKGFKYYAPSLCLIREDISKLEFKDDIIIFKPER